MAAAMFSQAPPPCLRPSLPPATVLLFVLLLSFSHNPIPGALCRCLPLLSAPIMTLTSFCREPPTYYLFAGDASPPLTFLSSLPSVSYSPFLAVLIVICQPSQCPAPALHHCALCTLPLPSLRPPPMLTAAAHPLITNSSTDREGGMGETVCVCEAVTGDRERRGCETEEGGAVNGGERGK